MKRVKNLNTDDLFTRNKFVEYPGDTASITYLKLKILQISQILSEINAFTQTESLFIFHELRRIHVNKQKMKC